MSKKKYMSIDGLLIDSIDSKGHWHIYITNKDKEVYSIKDPTKHNLYQNIVSYKNCTRVTNDTEVQCVLDIIYIK